MNLFLRKKRVLVIRPDRIGDVVLSTPIPREIKRKYPESFVAVLVRQYTRDIYLHNPYVDEILVLDDDTGTPKPFRRLVSELRQYRFTHAFMLLPEERMNYAIFLAGIFYRIGVGMKLYQVLTAAHYVHRHKYIPLRHEADYCLDMVRKIGIQPESMNPEIYLSEEETKKSRKIKNALCPHNELLIGIHSTHGNSSANMKVSEYRRLIEMLLTLANIKVTVTDLDPPFELKDMEGIEYPNRGKTLRESIVTFAALDCLVSASTGPMHIAAALKVKTVSVFCPTTATSPQLWGPLGNESNIILPDDNYHGIVCSGHPSECCFEGIGGIDAAKVFIRLKQFLSL